MGDVKTGPVAVPNDVVPADEQYLSLDGAVAVKDEVIISVLVPEWDKNRKVRFGSLTAKQMATWMESNEDKEKKKTNGLRLIVESWVNPDGSRIPQDKHEKYMALLEDKNTKAIDACCSEIMKLNGLRVPGEAVKNG